MNFLVRFLEATFDPEVFFERVREERSWAKPFLHLIVLSIWLSVTSVIAWMWGVQGDSPISSSLGAQMDVYPFWRETLLPQYGDLSYPMAMGLIMFEMVIISAIWIPIVFLVFRYLGGAKESWQVALLHAAQGFIYGLSPCAFGGFVPYLALVLGVYATLLQFFRGPAITLGNRSLIPGLFVALFLTFAILRYWQGILL